MILSRINYYENRGKEDYWEIKDVDFNMYNLIVGLNATGKTRLINVISGLVKLIRRKSQYTNGYWQVDFKKNSEGNYRYKLELLDGKVIQEEIEVAGRVALKREGEKGKIYSYTKDEIIDINPPADELTFHVRRDVKEYPFLEEILKWAGNFRGYQFSAVNPYQVAVPSDSDALLESLNTTPYLLVEALKEKDITEAIIKDFSLIGYPIDDVSVDSLKIQGRASEFPVSFVREKDLACKTSQMKMSQGMYRAFSLIVIMWNTCCG